MYVRAHISLFCLGPHYDLAQHWIFWMFIVGFLAMILVILKDCIVVFLLIPEGIPSLKTVLRFSPHICAVPDHGRDCLGADL